jgi:hypothetical protein
MLLAQLQLLAPRPAPLPDPPLVASLLFERPWALAIIILLLGVVLIMVLRRLDRPRAAVVTLIIAPLLALTAILVARSVTTPRETLATLTRTLISAAIVGDAPAVAPLLRSDLLVTLPGGTAPTLSRQSLLERLPADMQGPYRLRSHTIGTLAATLDSPDLARTQVQLTVVPEATGFPIESWWLITWARDPSPENANAANATNTWTARQITAQHIDGLSPSR